MKVSNLLWGFVFIVLGIILGFNAVGLTDINIFFDGWWTFMIIIPCFIDLFKDEDKTGDIIGLVIGIGLLFACNDIIDFSIVMKLIFPFILVMVGLSFIFKDSIDTKVRKEMKKLNNNSDDEYIAIFSSQNVDLSNKEFKGCSLNAIFGDIKLDLRDSLFKDDSIINVWAIFGGVTIYVPENVEVKVTSIPIFGGVSDNRKVQFKDKKKGKDVIIYINATCMFGGVNIK